ncbi:hypothetical protein BDN70DRAFT_761742, partial [Pholiota conissans]
DVAKDAAEIMTEMRKAGQEDRTFRSDEEAHRRGHFFNLATGISFGGGQQEPGNLVLHKKQATADALVADASIRRIAGFQSGCFSFYFPKIYHHYWTHLGPLYGRIPTLRANFPNVSIFPACTFNLGPTTATHDHRDSANVASGICAITALGNFDPTLGGHLILFDLKLVIEFPPGSTVLIPSALFKHGNTPIVGEGVSRMSFTQYCAGGLFRWVRYGFQTVKAVKEACATESEFKEIQAKIDGKLKDRTAEALGLFSTINSLVHDH